MSVVSALPVEYSYPMAAISDTPIFNALAATTALFSATRSEPAALSRSCVMPRSPRVGGGRHRRLSSHTDYVPGGRHRLLATAHA
jgi:hypothetical protein